MRATAARSHLTGVERKRFPFQPVSRVSAQLRAAVALVTSGSVIQSNRTLLQGKFARAGLQERTFQLGCGTMRCFVGGRVGRPLMLVHGFGGGALETWHKQINEFAKHFWLVVPDLFWFGQSQPHAHFPMDSPSQHAAALVELLDRLHIRRTHVVGVSFGGFVALQLARCYPQRVRRLALVNAAGLELTDQERRAASETFDGTDDLESVLVPADERALKAFLDAVFYRPRYMPRFVLRQLLRDEFWRHAAAKRRLCAGMLDELLSESHLRQIRCETMLLWGRHDPLLLPSIGERMARALPRARLTVLERCAHPPMLEQPKRFNQQVLHFLK